MFDVWTVEDRKCCHSPETLNSKDHVSLKLLVTTFPFTARAPAWVWEEQRGRWSCERVRYHIIRVWASQCPWTFQLHKPNVNYKNGGREGKCKSFQPMVLIIVCLCFILPYPVFAFVVLLFRCFSPRPCASTQARRGLCFPYTSDPARGHLCG